MVALSRFVNVGLRVLTEVMWLVTIAKEKLTIVATRPKFTIVKVTFPKSLILSDENKSEIYLRVIKQRLARMLVPKIGK